MLSYLLLLQTNEKKEKFILLYKCYKDYLYHVAYHMVKEEERAEDMVHETFLTLISHMDGIDEETYNVLKEFLKEKKKQKNIMLFQYSEKKRNKSCHRTWNYIVTILKNKIYDDFRRTNRKQEVVFDDNVIQNGNFHNDNLEQKIIKKEEGDGLVKCMKQLPYPYKEVLYLQYYNGLSSMEIGNILGKTSDNIRQISKRARDKLKNLMMEGGYVTNDG